MRERARRYGSLALKQTAGTVAFAMVLWGLVVLLFAVLGVRVYRRLRNGDFPIREEDRGDPSGGTSSL